MSGQRVEFKKVLGILAEASKRTIDSCTDKTTGEVGVKLAIGGLTGTKFIVLLSLKKELLKVVKVVIALFF
ncbi:hypothetical protein D3C85_1865540 [compost metagenome]